MHILWLVETYEIIMSLLPSRYEWTMITRIRHLVDTENIVWLITWFFFYKLFQITFEIIVYHFFSLNFTIIVFVKKIILMSFHSYHIVQQLILSNTTNLIILLITYLFFLFIKNHFIRIIKSIFGYILEWPTFFISIPGGVLFLLNYVDVSNFYDGSWVQITLMNREILL